MSGENRRGRRLRKSRNRQDVKSIFGTAVAAGAATYVRSRDLPRLLALWPHELDDESQQGRLHLLAKLRRALRTERRRARAAHWSYDLNRHLGLLSAYKGELVDLESSRSRGQASATRDPSGAGAGETRG